MALIAIIISLLAERFLGSMEEFRRFGWVERYAAWLLPRLSPYRYLNGPAGITLLLLIPLGAVAVVDYYLGQWWVLLSLLFSVLVLLFSFGPTDLEAEVEAYIDARARGDEESARWHAGGLLGEESSGQGGVLTRRVIENTLVEANERVVAILLWFLLLGPAGALMYRLVSQLELHAARHGGEAPGESVQRLHAILAWLPARICAFSYALAGSFVGALQAWGRQQGSWHETSRAVLIASGLGALGYHEGDENAEQESDSEVVRETLDLVRRAVLVFLSVIALFTLAGWMA